MPTADWADTAARADMAGRPDRADIADMTDMADMADMAVRAVIFVIVSYLWTETLSTAPELILGFLEKSALLQQRKTWMKLSAKLK